jgi:hypothetical protein
MRKREVQVINSKQEYSGFIEVFLLKDLIGRDLLREPSETELRKVSLYTHGLDF